MRDWFHENYFRMEKWRMDLFELLHLLAKVVGIFARVAFDLFFSSFHYHINLKTCMLWCLMDSWNFGFLVLFVVVVCQQIFQLESRTILEGIARKYKASKEFNAREDKLLFSYGCANNVSYSKFKSWKEKKALHSPSPPWQEWRNGTITWPLLLLLVLMHW